MTAKQILKKYPITNAMWKYSHHPISAGNADNVTYDGYYYFWLTDIGIGLIRDYYGITTDPWFRAFNDYKDYVPISGDVMATRYHSTVGGNAVLLVMFKKND